jgi:hypothetical protein
MDRRGAQRSGTARLVTALSAVLFFAPILASLAALVVVLHNPTVSHASTWGNTDQYESGEVPNSTQACFQSPIWGTLSPLPCVTQRYGCTYLPVETPIGSNSPSWAQACLSLQCTPNVCTCSPGAVCWAYWHPGIDIGVPASNPLYAIRSGTIQTVPTGPNGPCSSRGIFAETASNGNVIFYVHGTAAPNTYATQPVVTGTQVGISGSVIPCGGYCVPAGSCAHVHVEVHTSIASLSGSGLWDDINPEGWLQVLPPPGSPVVSWSPNRIDLFVRGLNYGFWHLPGDGSSWGTWENHLYPIGTTFASQPVAVSWGVNRIDLFGIGYDGYLYHQAWNGTSWYPSTPAPAYQNWQQLPPPPPFTFRLSGTPAVTTWGVNRLDIFANDTTGQVWHVSYDGFNWSWESIGFNAASDPVAVSWGPNRLDVFARLSGNTYGHQFWGGSGWPATWEPHGPPPNTSFASRPTLVSEDWNQLDILGIGSNGDVYRQSWTGTQWYPGGTTGWERLNTLGTSAGVPAVATWTKGRFDEFNVDISGTAWHRPYQNGWGLEAHGGVFTADLFVVSWGPNRLDVFGRGQDSAIYWQYWPSGQWVPNPNPVGTSWSPAIDQWISIGGQAT